MGLRYLVRSTGFYYPAKSCILYSTLPHHTSCASNSTPVPPSMCQYPMIRSAVFGFSAVCRGTCHMVPSVAYHGIPTAYRDMAWHPVACRGMLCAIPWYPPTGHPWHAMARPTSCRGDPHDIPRPLPRHATARSMATNHGYTTACHDEGESCIFCLKFGFWR